MNLDFSQVIDMKLAVILWLIGFGIKHLEWKPIKQLTNKLIPVILTIVGIGVECVLYGDVTFDPILMGIVTSMFAVGIHSSGLNAWRAFIQNSTSSMNITGDNLSGTESSYNVSNITTDDDTYTDHAVG